MLEEVFPIQHNRVVFERTVLAAYRGFLMKDLSSLLEEVQAIVQGIRDEKNYFQDRLRKVEEELGMIKQEKLHWEKDLRVAQTELERVQEESTEKLNRVIPEIRTLQDQLQDLELQNNLLNIELTSSVNAKDEEIKKLEDQLRKYTDLFQANSSSSPSSC